MSSVAPRATAKLTVRLPKENLDFAKRYAKSHKITVTELIDRQLRSLRVTEEEEIHPDVERLIGLIPADVDARAEHREYLFKKHG